MKSCSWALRWFSSPKIFFFPLTTK
jgi:hypothetical protein